MLAYKARMLHPDSTKRPRAVAASASGRIVAPLGKRLQIAFRKLAYFGQNDALCRIIDWPAALAVSFAASLTWQR
jgi:hypothetical protein